MKNSFLLLLLTSIIFSCSSEKKKTYAEEIEQFQYEMNVSFSDKNTSPLKEEDLKAFKKLAFFPTDSLYKIVAQFERTPDEIPFEMQTSTDRLPMYVQYGIATFTIDGKELSLRVYQEQESVLEPDYDAHLFIPFNDLTNGNKTYDAGRYIDLKIPSGNTIEIDFNKAYNPYCAYNDKWSCPIPPRENDLDVKIKAGVLAFSAH
ncbi:MAG: hypothetical protein COB73_07885 [Flavobacteriaceae bacterium]|nr:MAG: hypothetical protein COB73_07885 [Flavobacteriaceae bacterium]